MKKKNILTFVVAMVLVAALSVGGTLAYLTATDEKVENKFTFGDMTVELTEPTPDPDKLPEGVTTEENKDPDGKVIPGFKYVNILPGQDLPKNPKVETVTTTPAYLFIKISGASKDVMPKAIDSKWTAYQDGTEATYYNGIYYMEVDDTTKGQMDVFTEVKVSADATGEVDPDNIVIEVYEVQKQGLTLDQAAAQCKWAPAA